MKAFVIFVLMVMTFLGSYDSGGANYVLDTQESVYGLLERLGEENQVNHRPDFSIEGASAEKGEAIVKRGFTRSESGFKTPRVSKHFVCTSCHNIERDEPDLSRSDPQARLDYVVEKGLPFLQGSSLYGIVNRTSYYNGDYYKKYGDLVLDARNDLRAAVQLCAVECSQGRIMEDWELESVIRYLWTIELRVGDLMLNTEEETLLQTAVETGQAVSEAIVLIKSKFLDHSPAHFVSPPEERASRVKIEGDATNGALIYQHSCMYCHEGKRYSFFRLDYSILTFRNLKNNFGSYHDRSIYQVIRYGTSPVAGKKAYMPQYTMEKMSDQQLEDLKAYINREAGG